MNVLGALEAVASREEHGLLDLVLRRDANRRTVIARRRQRFPLRMTVPFYLDAAAPDMAFVYVQNPTGGVFAGDRLSVAMSAQAGARVHLTTQSATKLYRSEGGDADQKIQLVLGEDAYVENMPDVLIPHAGARYRQHTRIELVPGAMCLSAETIAPGRRARGERYAYELLELRTDVRCGGRQLCAETLRLQPSRGRPDRAGVLHAGDYLVSLLALAPQRDATALAEALDRALAAEPGICGAAGELPHGTGALVRALASDAPAAQRALRGAWAAARRELLGIPPPTVRK